MAFDYTGARQAGFSDSDIIASLADKHGFDLTSARKAKYDDGSILLSLLERENSGAISQEVLAPAGGLTVPREFTAGVAQNQNLEKRTPGGFVDTAINVVAPVPEMVGASFGKFGGDAVRWAGDAIAAGGNVIRSGLNMPQADTNVLQRAGRAVSGYYGENIKQLSDEYPLADGSTTAGIRSGLQSTGEMLATWPLAWAKFAKLLRTGADVVKAGVGAGEATITALSAKTATDAYDKYADRGHSFVDATAGGLVEGVIEKKTEDMENLPFFEYLSNPRKAGLKALGKAYARLGLTGQITEQLATLGQDATDKIMSAPGMTLEQKKQALVDHFNKEGADGLTDFERNAKQTAIATATMTTVMGGMGGAAKMLSGNRSDYQDQSVDVQQQEAYEADQALQSADLPGAETVTESPVAAAPAPSPVGTLSKAAQVLNPYAQQASQPYAQAPAIQPDAPVLPVAGQGLTVNTLQAPSEVDLASEWAQREIANPATTSSERKNLQFMMNDRNPGKLELVRYWRSSTNQQKPAAASGLFNAAQSAASPTVARDSAPSPVTIPAAPVAPDVTAQQAPEPAAAAPSTAVAGDGDQETASATRVATPDETTVGKSTSLPAGADPAAPRRGEIGMKLETGERVLTSSGALTAPFPKINIATNRTAANTLKRVDQWLMDSAIEEARRRGDKFNQRQFAANREKPSQADKDGAELYLFGEKQPDVVPIDAQKTTTLERAGQPLPGQAELKTAPRFEAAEIAPDRLEVAGSREQAITRINGMLPSHAESGKDYHIGVADLQQLVDTAGDGFLYRAVKTEHINGKDQDFGALDYAHKTAGGVSISSVSLTTSLQDALNIVDGIGAEGYTIYKVRPDVFAHDFYVTIPSERTEELTLHVQSPMAVDLAKTSIALDPDQIRQELENRTTKGTHHDLTDIDQLDTEAELRALGIEIDPAPAAALDTQPLRPGISDRTAQPASEDAAAATDVVRGGSEQHPGDDVAAQPPALSHNDKGNIDLRFPARPSDAVIQELEAAGFKFNQKQKVWYAPDNVQTRGLAERLAATTLPPLNPAPQKAAARLRNILSDIRQAGGITLQSLIDALDRNEVMGPSGRGNRYLRVTGGKGKGFGLDQMARMMFEQGWLVPVDLNGEADANGFAQLLKGAINGDLPLHPDNADRATESALASELARITQLTDEELDAQSLLSQAELMEFVQSPLDDLTADLFEALDLADFKDLQPAISDALTQRDQIIQEIEHGLNEREETAGRPGDTEDVQETGAAATGEETGSPADDRQKAGTDATASGTGESQAEVTNPKEPISNQALAERVSASGEIQNKLFATPPTFGKKAQTGTAVGTGELLDNFTSEDAVQPGMFGAAPEQPTVSVASLKEYDELRSRVSTGEISPAELRDAFASFNANMPAIRAELAGFKKDDILSRMGSWSAYRYKNEKKDVVVRAALEQLQQSFMLDKTLSYMMGAPDARQQAIQKAVDSITAEDITAYAEELAQHRQNLADRRAKITKAIENPETLEEFATYLKTGRKVEDLPAEKRQLYDELVAADNRQKQAQERLAKNTVTGVDTGTTAFTMVEGKHSKTGETLYVVQLEGPRLDDDAFRHLAQKARQLAGNYVNARQAAMWKTTAGFQFKSQARAEQFMALQQGDVVKEDTTPSKQLNAAAKLREVATGLKEKAEADLSRDRLANTARRAAMASSAEESARRDIALAETMLNLADAIERGDATHLNGLSAKTHVEQLQTLLNQAKWRAIRSSNTENMTNDSNRPARMEDVDQVQYPYPAIWGNHLRDVYRSLEGVKGAVKLRAWLSKATRNFADELVTFDTTEAIDNLRSINAILQKKGKKWEFEKIKAELQEYDRTQRIGIMDLPSLRAALREFLQYRADKREADRAKQLERSLVGQKVGQDFFPTPTAVAEQMVELAGVVPGMKVLEPSAGNGNIAQALQAAGAEVEVAELSSSLREVLEAKGFTVVAQDFMELTEGAYDAIVMNPPFSNNQDIEHVRHAYTLLKPGGKLVAIVGEGAFFRSGKTEEAFRDWLDDQGADVERLPEGTFTDRKLMNTTGANARMVVLEKPGAVLFYRTRKAAGYRMDVAAVESTIDRITSGWRQSDREAVILLDRFEELPAAILEEAQKAGYDNNSPDDRIYGVAYQGKIYLLHENLFSALDVEEALLHERLHLAVRSGGKQKLVATMNSVLHAMGGGKGLLDLAGQAGFDFAPYRQQAAHLKRDERAAFYVEEFLANVEGRRAYELLPQKVLRAIRELWGQFRAWLQDNGFTQLAKLVGMRLDRFTQADLAYLLKGIRGVAVHGQGVDAVRFMTAWHGTPHDDGASRGTADGNYNSQNDADESFTKPQIGEKKLERQVNDATLKADNAKGVADESDAIKNLRERIAGYDEVTIEPGAILEDDPKGAGFRLVRELASRLGRGVVFFKPGTGEGSLLLPQGAVIGGDNRIYINSAANDPHLLILGHELVHSIRNSDEKLYKRLAATIQPLLKNYPPYKAWQQAADPKLTNSGIVEEFLADFIGEQFIDTRFWDRINQKDPGLFSNLLDAIARILNKIFDAGYPLNHAHDYLTDLDKAREMAVDFISMAARSQNNRYSPSSDAIKLMTAWHGTPHEFSLNDAQESFAGLQVADLEKAFAGVPFKQGIKLLQSVSEVPDEVMADARRNRVKPWNIEAFTHNGQAWLVAENIRSISRAKALAFGHELAHIGQTDKLVDMAVAWFESTADTQDTAFKQTAHKMLQEEAGKRRLDLSRPDHYRVAVSEATARLAEDMAANGVKPGVVLKLVNRLRDLMRKLYGRLRMTDQELAGAVAEMLRVGEKKLEKAAKDSIINDKGVGDGTDNTRNNSRLGKSKAGNARERIEKIKEGLYVPERLPQRMVGEGQTSAIEAATDVCRAVHAAVRRGRITGESTWEKHQRYKELAENHLKPQEEAALREWAQANNKMLDRAAFDTEWEKQGKPGRAEHDVYFTADKQHVIKRNRLTFHDTYLDYFHRLAAHNTEFSNVPYGLIGFMDVDGQLWPVVQQPAVAGSPATWAEAHAAMLKLGYEPIGASKTPTSYRIPGTGMIVRDVSGDNSRISVYDGTLIVIDPVIEHDLDSRDQRLMEEAGIDHLPSAKNIEQEQPDFDGIEDQLNAWENSSLFSLRSRVAESLDAIPWEQVIPSTREKWLRTINPLDWSRSWAFMQDALPENVKAAFGWFFMNPVFQAERDPAKLPFVDAGEARENNRMQIFLDFLGYRPGQDDTRSAGKKAWQFLTSWQNGQVSTEWEDLNQRMFALSKAQKKALDFIFAEGDAMGSEYASLAQARTNPRIAKQPGLDQQVFDLYRDVRRHIDQHVRDARIRHMEAMLREIPDMTDKERERHIADYRNSDRRVRGWLTRDHGEGPEQVAVYHLFTAGELNEAWQAKPLFDKDGKPSGNQSFLSFYPGNRAMDAIEARVKEGWSGASAKVATTDKGYVVLTITGNSKGAMEDIQTAIADELGEDEVRVMAYMRRFQTRRGANKHAEKVRADYKAAMPRNYAVGRRYATEVQTSDMLTEDMFQAMKGDMALEAALKESLKKALKRGELDREKFEDLNKQLVQDTAEVLLSRAAGRYQIRRSPYLIEGYDTEGVMSLYQDYMMGVAGMLSKAQYAMQQYDNLRKAKAEVKPWATSFVFDSLRNMGLGDRISGDIRSLASFWLMGFKISSALINATQPYTMGIAELYRQLPEGRRQSASKMIIRAQKNVLTDKHLTNDERQIFDSAVYKHQEMQTALGELSGHNEGTYTKAGKALQALTGKSLALFQNVEVLNRKSVILAAYRVFRSSNVPAGVLDTAALQKAIEINGKVNFEMGRHNLPGWARGATGRTLYSLQSFTWNNLNWIFNRLTSGERRDQIALLRYAGILFLLGGMTALPGGDELDKLYRRLRGRSLKLDFQDWSRNKARQYGSFGEAVNAFAWHGLLSGGGYGVQASNAIRLQIPVVSQILADSSTLEAVSGVPGALVGKVATASAYAQRGYYGRAAESAAPEFLAGAARAIRQYRDGATTSHGKQIYDEQGRQMRYSAGDVAKRVLGFQPYKQNKTNQLNEQLWSIRAYWNQERTDLMDELRGSKGAKRDAVLRKLQQFNRELDKSQARGLVRPVTADTVRRGLTQRPDVRQTRWKQQHSD